MRGSKMDLSYGLLIDGDDRHAGGTDDPELDEPQIGTTEADVSDGREQKQKPVDR